MATKAINKDGSPRKSGSGRRDGSTSFEYPTLEELNELVKNGGIRIPISRVWRQKFFAERQFSPAPPSANNGVSTGLAAPASIESPNIVKPQFVDLNE